VIPRAAQDRATTARLQRLFQEEPELILAMLEGGGESQPPDLMPIYHAARAAAETRPHYADLQYFAAKTAFAAGALELADRLARRAVELNPRYHDALILSGRIAGRLHASHRAIDSLQRALSAGADYADVHVLMGDLYRDLGAADCARQAYRRALSINPTLASAQMSLKGLETACAGTDAPDGSGHPEGNVP
jgi:tetratricopeptide (TPR) repeat protein